MPEPRSARDARDVRRPRTLGRVFAHSVASGFADFTTIYTWRTWTFGWLVRVLAQVVFFALVGVLLGDAERVRYLVVGSAVMIAAMEGMQVVASTTWERRAGTLPLLVASPYSPALVFVGRSVHWLASGLATSSIAFFTVTTLFGVDLPWPRVLAVVPLIAVIGLAAYLFGSFLGALVLQAMAARNVVSNVAYMTLMAISGVVVPVEFWPPWVQWVASVLPVTHGLGAVRGLLAGAPAAAVARGALLELAVGLAWLVLALVAFRRLVERGRRDGSIEFAS